jgi:hypothetical protein
MITPLFLRSKPLILGKKHLNLSDYAVEGSTIAASVYWREKWQPFDFVTL